MAYQVYLDTNILSRLQDERITLEGAESLLAIARHPEVCLLVSRYTRAELESAVDPISLLGLLEAHGSSTE